MDSLRRILPEEIALEGLDGITLETLFVRLSNRLETTLDDAVKNEIWKIVKKLKNVDFYEIAADRPAPQIFQRSAALEDEEFNALYERDYNIYSYHPVDHPDIRGSCQEFETRKQVPLTKLSNMDLAAAVHEYNNKLVIVAAQSLRTSVLMPANLTIPTVELTKHLYCCLERIARSRYLGEMSSGPCSLAIFIKENSNTFYIRRELLKLKLIVRHVFDEAIGFKGPRVSRSQLFLPQYFSGKLLTKNALMQRVHDFLKSQPGHRASINNIMKGVKLKSHKSIRQMAKNCKNFSDAQIPYANPSTKPSKSRAKPSKTLNGLALVDPNFDKYYLDKNQEDDEEAEVESEAFLNIGNRIINMPLIYQVYRKIDESGPNGLSQNDIAVYFGMGRLMSRAIMKRLKKDFDIKSFAKDEGRQRTFKYVTSRNLVKNPESMNIDESFQAPKSSQNESVESVKNKTAPATNEDCSFVFDSLEKNIVVNYKRIQSVIGYENSLQEIKNCTSLTAKNMSRIKLILEKTRKGELIEMNTLWNCIKKKEADLKETMCRKSLSRLVSSLAAEKMIKLILIELKFDIKVAKFYLLCDESSVLNEEIMKPIVEDKIRVFQSGSSLKGIPAPVISEKDFNEMTITENSQSFETMPKFIKLKKFHEYLFYMVYECDKEYQEIPIETALVKWKKENLDLQNASEIDEDVKFCSSETLNWKTFLTPLKKREKVPEGWCLLRDVIYRMPLILLSQITRKNLEEFFKASQQFKELLKHPIKRNYLLHYLPESVQKQLLPVKYLNLFATNTIRRLLLMGLVQLGPSKGKENDNMFIYVNRNASVIDTTTSGPGYSQVTEQPYANQQYFFSNSNDLKKYWNDLCETSLATRLGQKSLRDPSGGIKYKEITYLPRFQQYFAQVGFDEAATLDKGEIPGDHRGAGGIDHAFFSFQRKHWLKSSQLPATAIRIGNKMRQRVITKRIVAHARTRGLKKTKTQNRKQFLKQKLSRKNRSALEASKLSRHSRAVWFESEDKTLILIKVALKFIFREESPVLDYSIIRDILHWKNEKSLSKTSPMCVRRVANLMKTSMEKVVLYLEELENDADLVCKYRFLAERLRKNHSYPKYLEIVRIAIIEFVIILHHKFYKRFNLDNFSRVQIPDSYDEIMDTYTIKIPQLTENYDFNEPLTVDEVEISAYQSFLIGVINLLKDNYDSVHQVIEASRMLDDGKVRIAIQKLHKMTIISISRKERVTRSSIESYHFSPRYLTTMMLQMPTTVFGEIQDALKKILHSPELHQSEDTSGCVVLLANLMFSRQMKLSSEKPEQLVAVDPTLKRKSRFGELSDSYLRNQTTKKQGERRVRISAGEAHDEKFLFNGDPIEWFLRINLKYLHIFCILVNMQESRDVLIKKFELLDTEWCCLDTCIFQDEADFENVIAGIAENFNGVVNQILESDSDATENSTGITKMNLIKFYDEFMKEQLKEINSKPKDLVSTCRKREIISTRLILENIALLATFIQPEDSWLHDYERISKQNEDSVVDDEEMSADPITYKKMSAQLKDFNVMRRVNDSFVINFSTMNVHVAPDLKFEFAERSFIKAWLTKYSRWTIGELTNTKFNSKFDSSQRKLAEGIVNFLKTKTHQGATVEEIKKKFDSSNNFAKVIENLVTNKDILRAGVTDVRFVHKTFAKHWLVNSCLSKKKAEDDELESKRLKLDEIHELKDTAIYVSPASWITVDGSVIRQTFDHWLSTVLSHINVNPGIYVEDLSKKFNVLKSTESRILCETLEKIGCVELKAIEQQDIDAFSQLSDFNLKNASLFDSNKDVFVELQPQAMIKLSCYIESSKSSAKSTEMDIE